MKKFRFLALVGLLGLGATASASLPTATPVARQHMRNSYQDGYNQGYSDTTGNKCIDGNKFESNYANYYRPRAEQNYQNDPSDYNQGYLDGQSEGHETPVICR